MRYLQRLALAAAILGVAVLFGGGVRAQEAVPECRTVDFLKQMIDGIELKAKAEGDPFEGHFLSPPVIIDGRTFTLALVFKGHPDGWIFTFVDDCGVDPVSRVSAADVLNKLAPAELRTEYLSILGAENP